MDVRVGLWRRLSTEELMLLNCGVGEESLGLQGDPTSPFWRRSALRFLWKKWCWSWNSSTLATSCDVLTHWKDSDAGTDWGQEEKGPTEDEMAGWHYWLNGREFRWTPGVGDGRGGLACCDSWGHKESEMTEQVNWTNCLLETNNKNNKWVIMETKCRIRVKIIVNNAEKWMSAVKIRKYEKFLSWRIEGNRKGNLGINTQRYNGKKKNFLH